MKTEQIDIGKIKNNPDNPRVIKNDKFKKLVASIKEFPKMLELRPIIVDENNVVLGGNMRLKACKEAGMKKVTIARADQLSEEEKKQFIIKDNASFGEWNWDLLEDQWNIDELDAWNIEAPIRPDLVDKKEIKNEEFEEEIQKYNDDNAELPIVPEFHEKYSYFVVLCTNEIDEEFVRNQFDLHKKHSSHKSTDNRLSNFIPFEKLQEKCLK